MSNQHREEHPRQPLPAPPAKGGPWELFFVENMRRLRERAKMTQTDLAKSLKASGLSFHQQTIQRIENGERPVRLNEAFLIAQVFDIELETMVSHLITEAEDISLEIERASRAGSHITDNILQDFTDFVDTVGNFAFAVFPLIPKIAVDETGQPTKPPNERFRELPLNVRIGLAVCLQLRELGRRLGDIFVALAQTFGDSKAETRPDVWEFNTPDIEVLRDIDAFIYEWDCEELRELSTRTLNSLFVESVKYSRKAPGEPQSATRDKDMESKG